MVPREILNICFQHEIEYHERKERRLKKITIFHIVSEFAISHASLCVFHRFKAPFHHPVALFTSNYRRVRSYQCSCPQWRSWEYGIQDQHPCTIFGHPFQLSCFWPSSCRWRKCEAASGKRAQTGRSTRSPWLR